MDVRMPVMDGVAATRALQAHGGPPVLVLTTFDDDDVVWGALHAGAAGFLLKDAPAEELVSAIHAVAAGGSWVDQRIVPRLLAAARAGEPRTASPTPGVVDRLSDRECEVLRLMATGASNPEIADSLHVSERTVKGHVGAIFAKLGARDRAAAIIAAYESGVIVPGAGRAG
jgi:DNA-binding NarL/FixJ family response regulator